MHWPIPLPRTDETNFPTLKSGDRHILAEHEWSYLDTWKAMEKLHKEGKAKAIGVRHSISPSHQQAVQLVVREWS